MKLIVGINKVTFDETDKLNAGEYNIHDVEFEFDEVYTNLVKKAVFSGNGHNYLVDIINNKCVMPYEVLSETGDVTIGAYGYTVEDEELVLRYSPSPTYIHVDMGSYKENYDNYQVPTADVVEQLEQEINNKQDILVSGTNIKTINNQSILGEGNINIQGGGVDIEAGENIYFTEDQDKTVINAVDSIYDDTEIKQDISDLETNKADKSEIPDVSDFITKDVNDLTYYYTKTQTDNKIPDVSGFITKNVNDLTYYTLKTSTGSLIDLEINSSTYVVTLSLKDIDGNVISSDTIDLPLESVVVSGSFDSTNKKIVLTLQNGNTVDIPVGDLVAGLQTEITSSNKLASDLVDDSNSGNKFATTSEKQTWNNKYDKPANGIPATDLASGVIPDLTNYIQKSQTNGLIKNDGTIDTNTYQAQLTAGTNITIENNVISASGGSSGLDEEIHIYNLVLENFDINNPSGLYRNLTFSDKNAIGTLLQKIYDNGDDLFTLVIGGKVGTSKNNQCVITQSELGGLKSKPFMKTFCGVVDYSAWPTPYRVQLECNLSWSGNTVSVSSGTLSVLPNIYLRTNNTTSYTPTGDYNPATKKYCDDSISTAVGDIATALDTINGEEV